jgi:hypothetical protein
MGYADPDVVKQTSGITANDLSNVSRATELDTLITALNDRAKSRIDEFCGRDFESHLGETVKVDGNGRTELSLRRHAAGEGLYQPIISLTSVKLHNSTLDASDYRIKPQPNSLPNRNAGIIERKHARWPEGWENIEVTLDWGFSSPPDEVKSVAESMVKEALLDAAQADKSSGAESVSMDGYSVSFSNRIQLSDEEKGRLKPFRRLAKA